MEYISLNEEQRKQFVNLVELEAERRMLLELEDKKNKVLLNGKRMLKIEEDIRIIEEDIRSRGIEVKELDTTIEKLKEELKPSVKENIEKNLKDIMDTYEYKYKKEEQSKNKEERIEEIKNLEKEIEKNQNELNEMNKRMINGDMSVLKDYQSIYWTRNK